MEKQSQFTLDFLMSPGENGRESFKLPSGYNYVAVVNNSPNTISLFENTVSQNDTRYALTRVNALNQQTMILRTSQVDYTVFWVDGGGVESHKLTLIFSTENLNLNGSLGGGVSASVTLATDGIGLARQSQLPAALSGGGNFKVDIQNQVSIGAVAQLPTSLAASGGLKVDDTSDNFGVAQYTVTTSGVQVAANQASEEVMFQAAKTNTGTVFVGNSTTQVIEVVPGAAISFPISNPNKFYYKGATAGDKLNVFWRF